MKEVLPTKKIQTTTIPNCKVTNWYGVTGLIPGEKLFITRREYNTSEFILRSTTRLTAGNEYPNLECTDFFIFLNSLLDQNGVVVYEFDDAIEFLTWLSE